jgi:hypothetical protein
MVANELFRIIRLASEHFKTVSPAEYRGEELPCTMDDEIEQICVRFMRASPQQRKSVSDVLDESLCTALFFFAERMAMLSVRRHSDPILLHGLLALVIIGPRSDQRELLMVLSLIYRSAIRLQVDPERLFRTAVHHAVDQNTRDLILGYLQRSPENRSIESMGYREFEGPSGIVYWFGKRPIPEGLM